MAGPYPQLVLFGDSLLQRSVDLQDGFSMQAELQSRFIRRLDVVNRGFSGWNTANAVKFLSEIFPKPTETSPKIKYLVVLLGANDAAIPTSSQHVPIDQYKENLTRIVTHPHIQAHNPKILLVTPPPVDEIKLTKLGGNDHAPAARLSAVTASYAEKAREVASENPNVSSVDLWKAIMDKAISMAAPNDYIQGGHLLGSPENGKQGGLDSLLPDGIHMSGEAYRVFYDELKDLIGEEWANLAADDRSGYVFPDWRVLNPLKE
ncbi:hypothetical protein H634G_07232 [Metarhizium anisopliae BRIP 53293]|uniref:SGNH hydrolase-type esterase domain-containing protein n=1 Tax=Metarhizium anisopliae BRIP 53293 TaxID=1291518 RepID=A0A0D9NUL4_METAN|nr:hypothetical protein H634G_07232 [Metarhizium anisopliae BRIP 53293]KJK95386.1 hypothetical protein H633G_00781 [Metarhizium anisopliae BRIP 53284]